MFLEQMFLFSKPQPEKIYTVETLKRLYVWNITAQCFHKTPLFPKYFMLVVMCTLKFNLNIIHLHSSLEGIMWKCVHGYIDETLIQSHSI